MLRLTIVALSVLLPSIVDEVYTLPCDSTGYKTDPTDCGSYYYCYQSTDGMHFGVQRCPSGLHYNVNSQYCDYPDSVNCKTGSNAGSNPNPPPSTRDPYGNPEQTRSTTRSVVQTKQTTRTSGNGQSSSNGGYKRVCYFTNWATYRSGIGKYTANDIDASLCTHLIYAFATLNANTHTIQMHDSGVDSSGYRTATGIKSSNLKVLLAIGGWTDSKTKKYSVMMGSSQKRSNFVRHVVSFLKQHNFDGLDLDLEYPSCWQGVCGGGPASDKQNFATFVQELRQAFDRESPRLLLTAAVAASPTTARAAYDVASLSRNLDFFNVMTYDYHGSWEKQTGHNAQFSGMSGDKNPEFNIQSTIQHYLNAGAPSSKLILGIATYGRSFTLRDPSKNGLGADASGGGKKGQYTGEIGILAFYEVCQNLKSGWRKVAGNSQVGPYAYSNNQWVGYLDVDDVVQLAKYAKNNNLGGAMFWTLDFDDFRGSCCTTKSPLLSAVKAELTGVGSVSSIKSSCP